MKQIRNKPRYSHVLNIGRKEALSPLGKAKRAPRMKSFLGMSIQQFKSKSKDEKLKAYYRARQSIENPELYKALIKEKELESLTQDLGVDFKLEKQRYGFFIQMVLNAKLPSGWSKELQKNGTLYYFNHKDGTYSYSHPCLSSFRNLMKNEYKKVLRSFSSGVAKSNDPSYKERTFTYLNGGPLRDMTLYKLSKYFTKGKRSNMVVRQENMNDNLCSLYEELNGYDLGVIKSKLKKMMPMKYCDIEETRAALNLLKIHKNEPELVWIARFYVALPLPADWEPDIPTEGEDNTVVYKNWFNNMRIRVKPCFFYINKLINFCKNNRKKAEPIARIWMVKNDHIFEDGFGRIHVITNNKLFETDLERKLKLLKKGFDSLFKVEEKDFDRARMIRRKYKGDSLTDPFVEKIEKYIKNPDLQDAHFILICKQLEIEPNEIKNAHLLFFIYNFVMKKRGVSPWTFRNPEKGEPYWINHDLKRISGIYPFLDELGEEINDHNVKIMFRTQNCRKKGLNIFKSIMKTKSEKSALKKLMKYRADYTQEYVKTRIEYNFQLYKHLKKKLKKKIELFEKRQKFAMDDDFIKDMRERPVSCKK